MKNSAFLVYGQHSKALGQVLFETEINNFVRTLIFFTSSVLSILLHNIAFALLPILH